MVSENDLLEAERLLCDELWVVDHDETPTISRNGERREVSVEVWYLMRAMLIGIGYKVQQELTPATQ